MARWLALLVLAPGLVLAEPITFGATILLGTEVIFGITVGTIAATVGTAVVGAKLFSGPRPSGITTGGGPEGRTVTAQSTNEPRRLVFGEPAKFSGHLVFFGTQPLNGINRYLWYVVRWCDHPIDSYQSWHLDDKTILPSQIDGSGFVDHPDFIDADGNKLLQMFSVDGTQTAVITALNQAFSEIDDNFVGHDIPHTAFRLEIDETSGGTPDNPVRKVWANGAPRNFQVRLRGLELHDTRTSTTEWSRNVALAQRWYLTDSRYGAGVVATKIPDSYINAAANVCDETVTVWDTGGGTKTQPRYTCDAILTTDMTHVQVVEILRDACAGETFWQQGQFLVLAGEYRVPTETLDQTELAGEISADVLLGDTRYNAVRGLYFDEDREGQLVEFSPRANGTYAGIDKDTIWRDIELRATRDGQAAQRLALIALKRSREHQSFSAPLKRSAVRYGVGDVVNVNIPYYGWSNKPFMVVELGFEELGFIRGVFREVVSDAWDYIAPPDPQAELDPPGEPATIIDPDSPPLPAQNLVADATVSGPRLSWDSPRDDTRVQIWRSLDNDRNNATLQAIVSDDRFLDEQTIASTLYYYWIIVQGDNNLMSTWEPVSITAGVQGTRANSAGLILDPSFDGTELRTFSETEDESEYWFFPGDSQPGHSFEMQVESIGVAGSKALRIEGPDQAGGIQILEHKNIFPAATGRIRVDVRYKSPTTANFDVRMAGYEFPDKTGAPQLTIQFPLIPLVDTTGDWATASTVADVNWGIGQERSYAELQFRLTGQRPEDITIDYFQATFVD